MSNTFTIGNFTYGITNDHLTVLRMNGQETNRYYFNSILLGARRDGLPDSAYLSVEVIDKNNSKSPLFVIEGEGADFHDFVDNLMQSYIQFSNDNH